MNCLSADDIYLYLEGELPGPEVSRIRAHLERCASCREALAERAALSEAADCVPRWTVPQDFARRVMERLFPQRLSLGRALLTAGIGTSVIVTSLFLVFLFSGLNLINFLISLNQSILNGLRDVAVFGARFVKMLTLVAQVFSQLTAFVWENLTRISGLPSRELQVLLLGMAVLFMASLYLGLRRLLPIGEKS
jgi:anti-sigma factor RsiW